jgi:hypothetical protein
LKLRERARQSYSRRHREPNEQVLGLELALRLSGDASILGAKKKSATALADSPGFQDAHPAIIGYLEEFGPISGIVTPAVVEVEQK